MARRPAPTPEGALLLIVLLLALSSCGRAAEPDRDRRAQRRPLPDVSGLAWIEGEAFLAVHDAKVPEEKGLPRVSVVEIPRSGPRSGEQPRWTPLEVDWPPGHGPSHDLESIARIPGTSTYLLVESGDGASPHRHLFVAELEGEELTIREVADWPVPVFDVEGSAVTRLGDHLYFVFAERAHGASRTLIVWAPLTLSPLRFGAMQAVAYSNPMPDPADTRPVSALEIDGEGRIWAASAYDPDRDEGPFHSAVWEVGRFGAEVDGEGQVYLADSPRLVARLEGLKAESLVMIQSEWGAHLFIGTDDEDLGGVLRRLPLTESGSVP